jgi:peptidoglycan-associated lipoprotein
MFYFKSSGSIFFSLFLLANSGCAPSTTKPDLGSAGTADSTESPAQSSGEGRSDTTRESNLPGGAGTDPSKGSKSPVASSSSLDQLKEGKSTATAASSPLRDVLFEFDSHDLRGDARDILNSNAEWLKRNASARVEVEGHCDERGTSEYNLALGAKRSQAARDYLVTLGIAADRISTISYGEEIPACIDSNENCWQQNRRARFVVAPSRPAS